MDCCVFEDGGVIFAIFYPKLPKDFKSIITLATNTRRSFGRRSSSKKAQKISNSRYILLFIYFYFLLLFLLISFDLDWILIEHSFTFSFSFSFLFLFLFLFFFFLLMKVKIPESKTPAPSSLIPLDKFLSELNVISLPQILEPSLHSIPLFFQYTRLGSFQENLTTASLEILRGKINKESEITNCCAFYFNGIYRHIMENGYWQ